MYTVIMYTVITLIFNNVSGVRDETKMVRLNERNGSPTSFALRRNVCRKHTYFHPHTTPTTSNLAKNYTCNWTEIDSPVS